MTSLDERLMAGLKVFERWRPALEAGFNRQPQRPGSGSPAAGRPTAWDSTGAIAGTDLEAGSYTGQDLPLAVPGWPPTLEETLALNPQMAPYSALLGACEDGLPFLLDLTNPAPGALLLVGDAGAGKTRLLMALLASIAALNEPEQVNFSIIARHPEEFMPLAQVEHCQEIFAADDEVTSALLADLADLAAARRRDCQADPTLVLVIDDLAACVQALDEEAYLRLYWLARHGPRSRVWTVAALPAERAAELDPRFLSAFRTRLVGFIADDSQAAALSGDERLRSGALEAGAQFLVPYGEEWLPLWICNCQFPEEDD